MDKPLASPTPRRLALLVAFGAVASGCTASASIGIGPPVVAKSTVEHNVAVQLANETHQPLPNISCPGDLTAKVGTTMQCVLTAQGSTVRYGVTVTVNSVSNGTAHFSAQVGKQPIS
ncbi:MAG: DUF4333 domain-containing protein [Acidimicrobiales bacterium]